MSHPSPLVSIIIPCFNAAPWLRPTVESALAQTGIRLEIIIVDDGSSDGSVAIAQSFGANNNVIFLQQPNSGAAAARNHGLSVAQGEYIQFLDADDLLSPDKISRQVARLRGVDDQAVAACAWGRFHSSPAEAVFQPDALWQDLTPIQFLVRAWKENLMMATGAWLVPRRVASIAGPWDLALDRNPVDDFEYFSRVGLAAGNIVFCAEAKVYYRSGIRGSLSKQRSAAAWEKVFATYSLVTERVLAREDSTETRRAAATVLQRLVFDAYPKVKEARRRATLRIAELGGCNLRPHAGPRRRVAQAILGWKLTKILHDWRYPS